MSGSVMRSLVLIFAVTMMMATMLAAIISIMEPHVQRLCSGYGDDGRHHAQQLKLQRRGYVVMVITTEWTQGYNDGVMATEKAIISAGLKVKK